MRRLFAALLFAVVALTGALTGPALAVRPDEKLADPALEARARTLSEELRCLVCQNQSIDDSDADLARDLRILVRERIAAGDSDQGVLDYLVARYGEFVLLRPRFNLGTALLWVSPFAVLLAGGVAVVLAARRRRTAPRDEEVPLGAEERARLAALLGKSPDITDV
jgi:cytochrome c-type biogenesis protein CcmH